MAISDEWFKRDGAPSANYRLRNRWRVRWHGESQSFPDINRKNPPLPTDRPPKNVEAAWAQMLTTERKRAQNVLVRDLVDRWLALKTDLSEAGYTSCRNSAAHVIDQWGDRLASTIGYEEAQIWINQMQVLKRGSKVEMGPASASMKHKAMTCLHGSLALGGFRIEGGDVKLPKQKRRPARWLEIDDLRRLAEECKGYESLVWTLGTTGLRIGEACALNVADVNTRAGRLQVRKSKNGEPRSVPVPASVLAMYDLERLGDQPLFTSARGHRVNTGNFRWHSFRPALERTGLSDLWIHGLRHVAASLSIASGADVKNVQNMLGHKNADQTLNIYAELWDKGLDDVSRRMDGLISGRVDSNTVATV